MNTERFERKLTAILSADVKGYSRLMRDDEDETVRTLTAYRRAIARLVGKYRGRVVDSPGDNLLAEFGSGLDAVNCAVEIQRELAERNEELPPERQMEFRIGVNSGDVIQEGDRIYGDGVNIAARVEGLAEGGGISISGTVYDSIEGKLGLEFEYQGAHEVKNIDKPIRVYRVLSYPGAAAHRVIKAKRAVSKTWRNTIIAIAAVVVVATALAIWHFYFRPPPVEVVTEAEMAFPLPDRPSIAVLPFVNVSGDPEQEYIADGITEQIIATLARNPHLFVIASNSTFTYKGKPAKVQQVSRELGIRYVMEGSVHKSGDRIRITAQLIDATTGEHLWAKTYDRDLKDIFALQDEITLKILKAVSAKVYGRETDQTLAKGTNNTEAYLKLLKASSLAGKNQRNHRLAHQIFEEAIALDSENASAYGSLARSYLVDVISGWSQSPEKDLKEAFKLAQKAISLDQSLPGPHAVLGWIYLQSGNHEKAIAEARRALDLAPNDYFMHNELGAILTWSDRLKEAISEIKEGFRLNPFPTWVQLKYLADAYYMSGRYEEALSVYKKMQKLNPDNEWAYINPIAIYVHLGRDEEARAAAKELLRIAPTFPVEYWEKWPGFKNKQKAEKWVSALREAGLPDTAPATVSEKPSIAVLPFANIGGDPKEDYLSDGITEQIITALSKTPKMLVIARNSVFTYKGKPVMVQQAAEELGVRYVLEGSVQKSGDRLRVTAQLIDAKTGNHLWSERYDREMTDLFDLQDDITKNVITALQVKLTQGENARLLSKGTKNLEAYLKMMKGREHYLRFNSNDNEVARQLFKEVISLDPNYASAYVLLAWTYYEEAQNKWPKTPSKSYEKVIELAKKAISIDGQYAAAYMILANVYAKMRLFEESMAAANKGLSLDPADSYIKALYGVNLSNLGKFKEAVPFLEDAIRIDPKPPRWYLAILGMCYRKSGQLKEAVSFLKRAIGTDPKLPAWYLLELGWAYFSTGQNEEAIAAFKEFLNHIPENAFGQNAFGHCFLGVAFIAIGEPQKAVKMFEKASAVNPDSKVWFIFDFATARFLTGQTEEAAATLREVLSRYPDNAEAYRGLALVLNYEGKYEEALPMAKKAVRLRPAPETSPYYYLLLGSTHLMIGENEEAIAALKKSIGVSPEDIYGNIWLTAAYSLAGRMVEARSQAAEVLRINPEITLDDIAKNGYYSFKKADKERLINALRKAGLS